MEKEINLPKTFDPFSVIRADCLAALDEPDSYPALAWELQAKIRSFAAKIQGGSGQVKLMVRNDFEEVAAEALVKAIAEEYEEGGLRPSTIEIVRQGRSVRRV